MLVSYGTWDAGISASFELRRSEGGRWRGEVCRGLAWRVEDDAGGAANMCRGEDDGEELDGPAVW